MVDIYPKQVHTESILPLVDNTRVQKQGFEITAMKKGVRVLEKVFWWVEQASLIGKTEQDVGAKIAGIMKRHGAEALAFPIIVASGSGSADVHHWSTKRKIRKGDILMIDCGCVVDGYCTDCTRTYFIGTPTARFKKYYTAVLASQERAIKKLKVGVNASSVDAVTRNYLHKHNWGKTFKHSTGHGVGINVHELPLLSQKSKDRIVANSMITIEPGVYIKNWGGIRIEDMVLVKQRGVEIVTKRILKDIKSATLV